MIVVLFALGVLRDLCHACQLGRHIHLNLSILILVRIIILMQSPEETPANKMPGAPASKEAPVKNLLP
jgi:hypothetical protein